MKSRDELADILADCHDRLDRGERVDREDPLAAHPELADELASCIDLSDLLDQAVAEDRLVREIGRGGMGVVYEAVQVPLERKVARKVLACPFERRAVRRFQ